MNKGTYLDNASTQLPAVAAASFYVGTAINSSKNWMNPSNSYASYNKETIEHSRETIARIIKCEPEEIIFTSGASEGNAFAMYNAFLSGYDMYISPYEHHNYYSNPRNKVILDEDVCKKDNWENTMYAHMLVSNLTGQIFNVNPLFEYVRSQSKGKCLIVCDCTQALDKKCLNMHEIQCDIAVFSGHKIGTPRGIGFMYIRKSIQDKLSPMIYGTQENGLRGGTYNTAGIRALEFCMREDSTVSDNAERYNEVIKKIKFTLDNCIGKDNYYDLRDLIGSENFIPSTYTFFLKGIESEMLQALLVEEEIYIGVGSGCNDGKMEIDPALKPYNIPEEFVRGIVRLSFCDELLKGDGVYVIQAVEEMCRVYKDIVK